MLAGIHVLRAGVLTSTARRRGGRPTCARRGRRGCRWRAAECGPARAIAPHSSRYSRADASIDACSARRRRARPAGDHARHLAVPSQEAPQRYAWLRSPRPGAASRAPSSSRSVTPASAEATTTSWPGMLRDESPRRAESPRVGQRRAAELPHFERRAGATSSLWPSGADLSIGDAAAATGAASSSIARRTAS